MARRELSPALDRPWRRPGALRYAAERIRGIAKPRITVTDAPSGLVVERDVEVPTRDGTLLRINVFRAEADGPAGPVMVSIHPYGKDALPTRRATRWTYSPQYRMLRQPAPVTFSALTGWEAPDPVWWTGHGFVVVNADARGCGRSDGVGRLLSHQEAEDTYDLVQWVAEQPWCDGRVVMLGVSYLAITQYAATGAAGHLPVGGLHRRLPRPDLSGRRPGVRLHPAVVGPGAALDAAGIRPHPGPGPAPVA